MFDTLAKPGDRKVRRLSAVVKKLNNRAQHPDEPSSPVYHKKNSSIEKADAFQPSCLNLVQNTNCSVSYGTSPSRKEVFQPHLPVRLPCYDLAPVIGFALGRSLRLRTSGTTNSHGLTGGVYKARERIHRAMADARLLANPASRSRVADSDPN